MKIARAGFLLAGLLTFATATTADAAVVITFENVGQATGNLSYGGTNGVDPLVGTNITFDRVTVGATILACVGCDLDFTTGANTSEIAGVIATFGGGGTFVINGTINGAGADLILGTGDDVLIASGVLLSGSFAGPVPGIATVGLGPQITFSGTGNDTKNPALLRAFGFSPDEFIYASTNVGAVGCDGNIGDGFNCSVIEADVVNTQQAPEPSSLLLFGMALIGAGRAARARFAGK